MPNSLFIKNESTYQLITRRGLIGFKKNPIMIVLLHDPIKRHMTGYEAEERKDY